MLVPVCAVGFFGADSFVGGGFDVYSAEDCFDGSPRKEALVLLYWVLGGWTLVLLLCAYLGIGVRNCFEFYRFRGENGVNLSRVFVYGHCLYILSLSY